MSTGRTKRFEYAASVDRAGRVSAEGGAPVELGNGWSAEHLVLGGVVRCTIASLLYFARQRGVDAIAAGSASGAVTKPEDEERYRFVEIECRLDAQLDPELPSEELQALLASAEWGCFVSASLRQPPVYRWRVNGRDVE
jgi:organic hydroperoxide reductase OsmC/OhrA